VGVPYESTGHADIRFRITGLQAAAMCPAVHIPASPAPSTPELGADPAPSPVALNGHCLVVEDNMIIALDAADILQDLGASYVSTASRVSDALSVLDREDIAFALLDVNLGDEVSLPVLQACLDRGIPAALATGYGADTNIVDAFPDVPVIKKPYGAAQVKQALAALNLAVS